MNDLDTSEIQFLHAVDDDPIDDDHFDSIVNAATTLDDTQSGARKRTPQKNTTMMSPRRHEERVPTTLTPTPPASNNDIALSQSAPTNQTPALKTPLSRQYCCRLCQLTIYSLTQAEKHLKVRSVSSCTSNSSFQQICGRFKEMSRSTPRAQTSTADARSTYRCAKCNSTFVNKIGHTRHVVKCKATAQVNKNQASISKRPTRQTASRVV